MCENICRLPNPINLILRGRRQLLMYSVSWFNVSFDKKMAVPLHSCSPSLFLFPYKKKLLLSCGQTLFVNTSTHWGFRVTNCISKNSLKIENCVPSIQNNSTKSLQSRGTYSSVWIITYSIIIPKLTKLVHKINLLFKLFLKNLPCW